MCGSAPRLNVCAWGMRILLFRLLFADLTATTRLRFDKVCPGEHAVVRRRTYITRKQPPPTAAAKARKTRPRTNICPSCGTAARGYEVRALLVVFCFVIPSVREFYLSSLSPSVFACFSPLPPRCQLSAICFSRALAAAFCYAMAGFFLSPFISRLAR